MNLLIAGNSQAIRLMDALEQDRTLVPDDWKVNFALTPGGTGPYLKVEDGILVETRQDPNLPIRYSPPEVISTPMNQYDAIVISALGYVDGGYRFNNPIHRHGTLWRFRSDSSEIRAPLVSESCFRQIVHSTLSTHPGARFLADLRSHYSGQVFVQQFPYLSGDVRQRDDWHMREVGKDPEGMHDLLVSAATDWLKTMCAEHGATPLLPPPGCVLDVFYTDPRLMSKTDGCHMTAEYGAQVLEQLVTLLSRLDG